MKKYTDEFLSKIIKIYQPKSQAVLTMDDAREIADNWASLFRTMAEIEKDVFARDTVLIMPSGEWFADPKNDRPLAVYMRKHGIPAILSRCPGMPIYIDSKAENQHE